MKVLCKIILLAITTMNKLKKIIIFINSIIIHFLDNNKILIWIIIFHLPNNNNKNKNLIIDKTEETKINLFIDYLI